MTNKLKYLFLFVLVTVAVYGLSTLFLSYLKQELVKDLPLPGPERSPVEHKAGRPPPPADSLKALAKRTPSAEGSEEITKTASGTPDKPSATSLNLRLLGTVVNEKGLSWAVILDLDNDRQTMVNVGSVVAGARVVSIQRDKVTLRIDGTEETLLLGAEGARPDQAPTESTTSTYVVSKEVFKQNLDNLPSVLMQARAELYFKEGQAEGLQLSQIQRGSILRSVGFEEGDVIQSVNGREIRSLEDAINLYQQMQDKDSYTIGILRGEKPTTLQVKIR